MGNLAVHSVNIAQMKVSTAPDSLNATGLGSCVGVVIYDPVHKIGGMIHVLLPNAEQVTGADNRTKFANPGIYDLLESVLKAGANRSSIVAKLAGGSAMISSKSNVGERNIREVLNVLSDLKIRIIAQDVGGSAGRSVSFDLQTGAMSVFTLSHGKKTI